MIIKKEGKNMVKVDIISGFLGAGKTTLIQKLLEEYKHEKVVLIENEFGDVGIDSSFLKQTGIEIHEMNSGCICCSLVGDFREALQKAVEELKPDRLIIEPSGVGKLSDVSEAVIDVHLHLNALVCVVDVNKVKMYHQNFKEFFDNQVQSAKTIIFSRTQLADQEKLAEAVAVVKELNSEAHLITSPWQALSARQILEVIDEDAQHNWKEQNLEEHDCCGGHHHHEEEHACCGGHHHEEEHECCGGHNHDKEEHECCCGHHHHADEVFDSIAFETIHVYTEAELQEMLSKLDESVLRAKGMVSSAQGWLFFDYVPGEINIRKGAVQPIGKIVVIGNHVDRMSLKELFKIG